MKRYPCMKTGPCLLFLLAWLIPSPFKYAAAGISLIGTHNNTIRCIGKEREALLQFKQEIGSDYCGLFTWWDDREDGQSDCCKWPGIGCDKLTGHVISLEPQGINHDGYYCNLQGKISPSLVELEHLKYLDLSYNGLDQTIPGFIGSLPNLQYLNLSGNHFYGKVPYQLANLSSLISLDLSSNDYHGLYAKSLWWLSRLTLLTDINLSVVNLSLATNWLQIINGLPFLRSLHLDDCSLPPTIPSLLSYKNSSTTLRVLSLTQNTLNSSPLLQWLSNLTGSSTGLEYLDLSTNGILSPIPSAFGRNMHFLSFLDLSFNQLQGPIPSALGSLRFLSYLDLSSNRLEGQIPGSVFELKHLEYLSLFDNNFQGIQLPNSLDGLCSLERLDLGNNNITNDFSSLINLFSGCANNSLVFLDLRNNSFWGSIPSMIGTFSSLETLSLGINQLNGTISSSLGRLSKLESLDLSSNSWRCTLSNHHLSNLSRLSLLALYDNSELVVNFSTHWVPPFQLDLVFLSSCKLGPYFPKWLLTQTKFIVLDISNTRIHDVIPDSFWKSLPSSLWQLNLSHNEISGVLPNLSISFHIILDLSSNHIEGAIPSFLGGATMLLLNDNRFSGSIAPLCPKMKGVLQILDLSNNLLSGELPDCWEDLEETVVLRLDDNKFTGKLPPSIGALNYLSLLSMRNNSFNGELQRISFENWTSLSILDLGYNSFTGFISEGIGKTLKSIQVLDLRRNNLVGRLPFSLCQLTSLQILDLSSNHISGALPECICNLLAMTNSANNMSLTRGTGALYNDVMYYLIPQVIMWKRKEQIFISNLGLVRSIAISDNGLEGQIPSEISCLRSLTSLDLARNNLTGSIPPKIGELASLEFLDLSRNHLSGQIPLSLANINFLGTLDLSHNNLHGKIPMGTQLQCFEPSAYMGNPGLCGPPLPECTGDSSSSIMPLITQEEENGGSDIFPGMYISVVLGFIVGFWGVCGTLVIKRSWRHSYFRFVEDINNKLHEMVAATIDRVWRRP